MIFSGGKLSVVYIWRVYGHARKAANGGFWRAIGNILDCWG